MKQSDFRKGQKWRVVRAGARVSGMKPIAPYAQQGWGADLPVGTVLTCAGRSMTFGDGAPVIKWQDANGKWLANDCTFSPSEGGMWGSAPADGYLQLIEDAPPRYVAEPKGDGFAVRDIEGLCKHLGWDIKSTHPNLAAAQAEADRLNASNW